MPTLQLADGRTLDYVAEGPSGAPLVVLQHGTPAVGVLWAPLLAAARSAGLRLAAPTRPGYGGSTPRPGRCVADAASDIGALADHLGAERFATAGWSGGGPHALCSASLLGERCAAVAVLAGVAPHDARGLDWLAGMGQGNLDEFAAATAGEAELTSWLQSEAPALSSVTAAELAAAMATLLPDADLTALQGPMGEEVAATFRAALASGVAGWRDDDLAFTRPWFGWPGPDTQRQLADIAAPVCLWQGTEDLMVPVGHARWLAEQIPRARLHTLDGEGHLSVVARCAADVVDWLGGQLG